MSETYLGTPPAYVDKWLRKREIMTPFYVEMLAPEGGKFVAGCLGDPGFLGSKDGVVWEKVSNNDGIYPPIELKQGERLYLKNEGYQQFLGADFHFSMGFYNTSRVGGNIISLIDKDFAELDYSTYAVYDGSFVGLFSNEKNLVDASQLVFPNTKIDDSTVWSPVCYHMFENCTSLVGAPRLRCNELIYEEFPKPSTKLPFEYWVCCTFNEMFKGCTALEKVRFAKELESNEKFRSALEHSSCFGAVNAKAVFDL